MNTEIYVLPVPVRKPAAAPRKKERLGVGKFLATFAWQLFVIATGIVVGGIVAMISGLFLGWISFKC